MPLSSPSWADPTVAARISADDSAGALTSVSCRKRHPCRTVARHGLNLQFATAFAARKARGLDKALDVELPRDDRLREKSNYGANILELHKRHDSS